LKFNLIDVGSEGLVSEVWKKEYINHIMTFDPLDMNGDKSLTPYTGDRFHCPIAVFDIPGKRKFHICRKSQMSSLFEPDMNSLKFHFKEIVSMFDVVETIEVKCDRLDNVIKKVGVQFDFLKVDVQGAELNVLESAGDLLSSFKGIQVECNHVSFYKGGSMTNDIDNFLESKGFIFTKKLFYERHIDVDELVWNDYLYINKKATFAEKEFMNDIYTSEIFIDREV
jgi:FkbM family methyltransferase